MLCDAPEDILGNPSTPLARHPPSRWHSAEWCADTASDSDEEEPVVNGVEKEAEKIEQPGSESTL